MDFDKGPRSKLLKKEEKKISLFLVGAAIIFSAWFYLMLTSGERFDLAHGYGFVSETKELIGILGIATYLKGKRAWNPVGSALAINALLFIVIYYRTAHDWLLIFNNMAISHGRSLLPVALSLIPIIAFLALTFLSFKLYRQTSSNFTRLMFIGVGLIFLRTLVHGVHTVLSVETHFFQSGFDALGGLAIASAYYPRANQKKTESVKVWGGALLLLMMAVVYAAFTFFKFR